MILEALQVGHLGANCYILGCERTKEAAVIDPGGDGPIIVNRLNQLGLQLKYIIATHGHGDHILGINDVKDATGAKVLIHPDDASAITNPNKNSPSLIGRRISSCQPEWLITDGDKINVGDIELTVLHTPGHTRGGICLYGAGVLFSGDTLFAGSIGRTDFPGGDYDQIISSIKNKLLNLPDDTQVYPGHMGFSTIGEEKKYNPFLR